MRKWWRFLLKCMFIVAVTVGILLFGTYHAAKQVPDFYQQAMQQEPAIQEVAGDQLEKQVLDLHNEVREAGRWEAVFTDKQINGWLAVDLKEKFSDMMPVYFTEPRVAIDPSQVQIACQYTTKELDSVVSMDVDVYLVDQPNVVAVRVLRARAGAVPVPLKQILDGMTTAARNTNVKLQWSQSDGDPVALITIPDRFDEHRLLQLDTLELRADEVYFSGTTDLTEEEIEQSDVQSALIGKIRILENARR